MTIRSISNYYLIDVSWYYESEQPTKLCSGQRYLKYSCSIGNGAVTVKGNGAHDYNLTITWNGETITSGVLSQSDNNGDHVYRFYLKYGYTGNSVERNRYYRVTG